MTTTKENQLIIAIGLDVITAFLWLMYFHFLPSLARPILAPFIAVLFSISIVFGLSIITDFRELVSKTMKGIRFLEGLGDTATTGVVALVVVLLAMGFTSFLASFLTALAWIPAATLGFTARNFGETVDILRGAMK